MEEKEELTIEDVINYAQLAVHILQNTKTEVTSKSIQKEIKMLNEKFGTKEVKRLVNLTIKKKNK